MVRPWLVRSRLSTFVLAALPTLFGGSTAAAQVGPGIGNIDCGQAEYFKPFAFIDHQNGGDPHGQNVTTMIRGYFLTVYAPDSGLPPGRIGVYDVSDPHTPQLAKYYSGGDTNNFREQHSLPVGLIDGKQYIAMQTRAGIQFWDFTDPLNAYVAGRIDLPGVTGGDYENVAWQASWQGHYLYVAGGNQGIYVINAADPLNPSLLTQVSTSKTGGFRVGPLFAVGDLLVMSNMDQGGNFGVLDISNPAQPALLDTLGNAPRMYAITVGANHRFYTAGRDGNFLIHSFSDPTNITQVKNAFIGQDQLYTAVQDHYVFIGRQENVIKVDVTNEQDPQVVGEGTLNRDHPDHGQVTPMGNLIYIGNDHGSGSAFFCHQMGQDTTPLVAQTIYPKDGATSISSDARVTIVFSDFVDLEKVSPETITIRPVGGEAIPGIYTYQFNQLSFSPDEPFPDDTTFQVHIPAGGLADVMGNALSEDALFHFSTGSDVSLPVPDPPPPPMGSGGATTGAGGAAADPPFVRFSAPPATGGAATGGAAAGGAGGSPGSGSGGVDAGSGGVGVDVPSGQAPGCAMSAGGVVGSGFSPLLLASAVLGFAARRRRARAS